MTAALIAALALVVTFGIGPWLIVWAARRADRDRVPPVVVEDALAAYRERRAS